jgi:hypothetical protein
MITLISRLYLLKIMTIILLYVQYYLELNGDTNCQEDYISQQLVILILTTFLSELVFPVSPIIKYIFSYIYILIFKIKNKKKKNSLLLSKFSTPQKLITLVYLQCLMWLT